EAALLEQAVRDADVDRDPGIAARRRLADGELVECLCRRSRNQQGEHHRRTRTKPSHPLLPYRCRQLDPACGGGSSGAGNAPFAAPILAKIPGRKPYMSRRLPHAALDLSCLCCPPRRRVLKGLAAVAVGAALPQPPAIAQGKKLRIDVHHHFAPPGYD